MKTEKGRRTKRDGAAAKAGADSGDPGDWRWADPAGLKVNAAFQGLIPLQSKGEFQALEQSILAEGCRDPITIWMGHNLVLDGHTRRELCVGHKKQVKVREVELPDEHAAVEYILTIQRQRRNLTREAMSYFRGAEYNAVKRRRGGRRARGAKNGSDAEASTALRLAEKYGVSEKTIKRDSVFARAVDALAADHGDPEVKRKLLGADVRLTQGTAAALSRMPIGERKAALDTLIEQGELPRAKTPAPARPRDVAQSIVARLKVRGEDHARSVVQQMARLLGMEVGEKPGDE